MSPLFAKLHIIACVFLIWVRQVYGESFTWRMDHKEWNTFNCGELAIIKNQKGLNSDKIGVKEKAAKTGAFGLFTKAGRYGDRYAYKGHVFEAIIRRFVGRVDGF